MSERACARGCECGARAERTLKPGDAVRWWPDGHDDDDRALVDRYIDGTVTALRPLCIRVTGSRGFTERIPDGFLVVTVGAVLDTSISPGTIQRLNPAPRAYVPGEKMTDRHPDSVIAQVVEGTLAEHGVDSWGTFRGVENTRSVAAATALEEAWRRFDQAFPPGEPKLGDLVRWWPHVTDLGTPAAHAEWIDGLVTAKYRDGRLDIRVTARLSPGDEGPEIQTTPGTLVRCHRQQALYVNTPAGPVKVTADLPVPPGEVRFAQPGAGEAFRGVDRSATPEKLSGAVLQKSAPAQPGKQWVAPVICEHPGYNAVFQIDPDPPPTTRPDGFDQRQVDACKAALLAPAPPRYPRTR